MLRKRPHLLCAVQVTGDVAIVRFGNEGLSIPAHAAYLIEYILKVERFCVRELPRPLTRPSKLLLVRTLLGAGMLEVVDRD